MSKYLWCEDKGAGFKFWKKVIESVNSDIQVESKGNNSELRKAVSKITKDDNTYYILIDNAMDNPVLVREGSKLKREVAYKKNVFVVDVFSFEYALLSFKQLESWVFAENDELRVKRKNLLELRKLTIEVLENEVDASVQGRFYELIDRLKYNDHNIEQLTSKLIYDITRNTGFETTKGKLGECFYLDCCEWSDRQGDDICGLDNVRISSEQKMIAIVRDSVLFEAFRKAGLIR